MPENRPPLDTIDVIGHRGHHGKRVRCYWGWREGRYHLVLGVGTARICIPWREPRPYRHVPTAEYDNLLAEAEQVREMTDKWARMLDETRKGNPPSPDDVVAALEEWDRLWDRINSIPNGDIGPYVFHEPAP